MRRTDQLPAVVLGDLDELVVDAEDVALLVSLGDDARDIHDVGANLQLGLDRVEPGLELGQRGLGVSMRGLGGCTFSGLLLCLIERALEFDA